MLRRRFFIAAFALILLLAVVFLSLFPQYYLIPITRYKMTSLFEEAFDAPFSYDEIRWEEGRIELINGYVRKGESLCHIKQAFLIPHFDWKKWGFHGEFKIQEIVLQEGKTPLFSSHFLKLLAAASSLTVTIEKGSLQFSDDSNEVGFVLRASNEKGEWREELILNVDISTPPIIAVFCRHGTKLFLSSSFKSHPAAPLVQVLRTFLGSSLTPVQRAWELQEGALEGEVEVQFDSGELVAIQGELEAFHLLAKNRLLALEATIAHTQEKFFFDFQALPRWEGEFEIEDGNLSIEGKHKEIWHQKWDLTHLDASLVVKNGKVQASSFEADFLGMRGEIALNWHAPTILMEVNFIGTSREMAPFIPAKLQKGWKEAFSKEKIALSALLARKEKGVSLEGKLLFIEDDRKDEITFGCDFEEERFIALAPSPLEAFICNLKSQFYLFSSRHGWLKAKDLALEKYLSPFLFPDGKVKLSGRGDIEGWIEDSQLCLFYRGEALALDAPAYFVTATEVGKQREALFQGECPCHFVDFATGYHCGYLPVKNGVYHQKTHGLTFSEIEGIVHFENEKIAIKEIKTTWDSLLFQGEVGIQMPKNGDSKMQLQIDTVTGSTTDAQRFLAHLVPSFFWEVPTKGKICGKNIAFDFLISSKTTITSGKATGNFTTSFPLEKIFTLYSPTELQNFSTDFDYDFIKNRVVFTEGKGCVKGQGEPFVLEVNHFTLSDFPQNQVKVDFTLSENAHEVVRFSAATHSDPRDPTLRQVEIDEKTSHIGNIVPTIKGIVLQNWKKYETFHVHFKGAVAHLLESEKYLKRLGLPLLPSFPYQMGGDGEGEVRLVSDGYDISFLSSNFCFQGEQLGRMAIEAKKNDQSLQLTHFHAGKFQGGGHISSREEGFRFDNCRLTMEQIGTLLFEGEYDVEKKSFQSCLHHFTVDLSKAFEKFPLLNSFPLQKLQGSISGNGNFSFACAPQLEFKFEAMTSFDGLAWDEIPLGKGENALLKCSSDQGFSIEGAEIAFFVNDSQAIKVKLGRFIFKDRKTQLEGFKFSFPQEIIASALSYWQQHYPIGEEALFDALSHLKRGESLEGEVDVEIAPDTFWVHFTLAEGRYYLFGKEIHLANISCLYDPCEINLWTEVLSQEGSSFWVHLNADGLNFTEGKLALSDGIEADDRLVFHWSRSENYGWSIESIEGVFYGLDLSLHSEPDYEMRNRLRLFGHIGIDWKKACYLLPDEVRPVIEKGGLGGGFDLNAHITISKNDPTAFTVMGKIEGKECELIGAKVLALSGDIWYEPHYLQIRNLEIKDRSGVLEVPEFFVVEENEKWKFKAPSIKGFHVRPALIRNLHLNHEIKGKKNFQSLLIRSFEISPLVGMLGEKESLRGKGTLQFTNYPRNGFISNILLIPTDIIARIGLDLTLFVPVRGVIDYEFKGDKVYLTQVHEMYSDAKRSRFFLSKENPSYVDLNGNLSINVKMKQYNLLKIVEFLTLSVRGTLDRPSYTLKAHSKKS